MERQPASRPAAQPSSRGDSEAVAYPSHRGSLPPHIVEAGQYIVRFAAHPADLEAVQALRFRVFNLELGEGLDSAHVLGRDEDPFDAHCHHLMVINRAEGAVIGTYRMQTHAMAAAGLGYYADTLFDLSGLPENLRNSAVETGRACNAEPHRNGRVLFLLWRGLASYMRRNGMRYLFGCSSLTSQDPQAGLAVHDWLRRHGHLHPQFLIQPRHGRECRPTKPGPQLDPEPKVPRLMGLYLESGAKVCGPPALDGDFKTIDFFTLMDVEALDPRTRRKLFG